MEAAVDLQPLQLEFDNDDRDEHVVERELPAADENVDVVDDVVHELPEQELQVIGRAAYQRFLSRYRRWVQRQAATCEEEDAARQVIDKLTLSGKTPNQKISLARAYWRECPHRLSDEEKQAILSFWQAKTEQIEKRERERWFRGNSALWTYQGDWGIMADIPVSMTRAASKKDDITDVVLKCQNSKRLLELWKDFEKFVTKFAANYHFNHYALAFELCSQTLQESRAVRVHAHLCCRSFQRVSIESPSLLAWQGGEPHTSRGFSQNRQRAVAGNACFYYLQCPKIGSIYQAANLKPFQDYLVSGEWVFNLLQQDKMTLEDARGQIIRSAKNLQRMLPNLDAYQKCL